MDGSSPGARRVYRRTWGARIVSTSVLVFSAGFLLWFLFRGEEDVPVLSLWLLLFFFATSAWASLTNWWDRVVLDAKGLRVRNAVLESVGWPPPEIEWERVAWIREHRGRALIVKQKDRRRKIVLDSLEGYREAIGVVQERTGIQLPRVAPGDEPVDEDRPRATPM